MSDLKNVTTPKHVTIHTDGGCDGNPGPGGWGAVLQYKTQKLELSGGEPATTNNRMELQAAIGALRALKEPCAIVCFTDSQYLRHGISTWIKSWKARGWRTADKQPVRNVELWRELDALAAKHKITWKWLKGHAGHPLNERCDQLAGAAIAKIRKSHSPAELKARLAAFNAGREPDADQSGLLA